MDRDEILRAIAELPQWRHRIPLGQGVVTPGREDCETEVERLGLPASLAGSRVLDVGCSDGYYSFECERRGARHVLAIDDMSSLMTPGTNGFTIAHRILGSRVELEPLSLFDLDPAAVGRFDVVLFLNVLYHLPHPFLGLEKIARVTAPGATLFLKTYFHQDVRFWFRGKALGFDLFRGRPVMRFFEAGDLMGDPTNWWGPNRACVEGMLRASGFSELELLHTVGDRLYYRCRRG